MLLLNDMEKEKKMYFFNQFLPKQVHTIGNVFRDRNTKVKWYGKREKMYFLNQFLPKHMHTMDNVFRDENTKDYKSYT